MLISSLDCTVAAILAATCYLLPSCYSKLMYILLYKLAYKLLCKLLYKLLILIGFSAIVTTTVMHTCAESVLKMFGDHSEVETAHDSTSGQGD